MRIPGAWHVRRAGQALAGALRRRSRRGLILLYHRIAGPRFDPLLLDVCRERFARHLAVLARETTVLALDELETLRRTGGLPPRAVAITFDDGYADNLAAAELLREQRMPATVFVATATIGTSDEFWWDDLERVAFALQPLSGAIPLEGVEALQGLANAGGLPDAGWNVESGADPGPRHKLYRALVTRVRTLAPGIRDDAMQRLRAWAGVSRAGRDSHRALTRSELVRLASMSGITIGAHTVHHPVLASLGSAVQRDELATSADQLRTWTGQRVTLAAYPFGGASDVNADSESAARAAGMEAACANVPGAVWRWSSPWRLPRMLVRDWDEAEFARRLSGWWDA